MVFQSQSFSNCKNESGDIPRAVKLNNMDLWVQIHELRAGFMTEKSSEGGGKLYWNFC